MPGKLLKKLFKKKAKPNPNIIDDIDIRDLRFKGVNRDGKQIVKKGVHGEVSKTWLQGLKDANPKIKNPQKKAKKDLEGQQGPMGFYKLKRKI